MTDVIILGAIFLAYVAGFVSALVLSVLVHQSGSPE